MASAPDKRQEIDNFLAAQKALAGVPRWQPIAQTHEQRLVLSVMVGGEIAGPELEIHAYPALRPLRFNIALFAPKRIWGVDYDMDVGHTNSMAPQGGGFEPAIIGPHFHSWADNRRFATASSLPSTLPLARRLPNANRTFENTLRWFCGETNITIPPDLNLDLPSATRLVW